MTPLPLAVTVNSGWVICSRIQIELLSKTVDSSSDSASCGLAKTRFPPVTGVPALAELLLLAPPADGGDEEADDPQPASATRAQPTVRAVAKTDLCLTSSSGERRSDGFVAKGDDVGVDTTLCAEGRGTTVCRGGWAKVCANLCATLYGRICHKTRGVSRFNHHVT